MSRCHPDMVAYLAMVFSSLTEFNVVHLLGQLPNPGRMGWVSVESS